MTGTRPATPEELDRLRELHAQDLGRNEIMRVTGWSGRFVTDNCRSIGLAFARGAKTAAATAAKKADAKQLRAELALNLLLDADRMRRQLFAAHVAFNFGGKENTYTEQEIPEPTPADKRALMSAIAAAIDKSIVIDKYDSKTGEESDFDRWLEVMSGGGDEP